ncbi:uncharacterized protein F4817DRAFT_321242 [Daldinia loculata]|uniref:uncharacterized protein n=1 Tax=Daldinia loculata TaxID=103429 RepID=UPI0020C4A1F4|nr:uncharacterized protein F4817DRAFT_321242 [Daldinia loculata]KAI1641990.1 hypothetical protein F4817DRAFT_321242 [Daldinia loculata]
MKFSAPVATQLFLLGAQHVLANTPANVLQAASDSDSDYITSVCSSAKAPDQTDPAPCIAIQGAPVNGKGVIFVAAVGVLQ